MFTAKLHILPAPQQRLWRELNSTPAGFILYGGTALAVRLGHRQSRDFDFFTARKFHPAALIEEIPYLRGAQIQLSKANSLTCLVDRGGPVRVSFFGGLDLSRIGDPDIPEQGGPPVASLLDLAATKVKVVQDRASVRDYADVDALLQSGISLDTALSAALGVYGVAFNPLLSLKALTYFEDGDLPQLTSDVRQRLRDAVRSVSLSSLAPLPAYPGLAPAE